MLRSQIVWDDGGAGAPGGLRLIVLDDEEIDWEHLEMEGEDALAIAVRQLRA